jgi:hypothetical protein
MMIVLICGLLFSFLSYDEKLLTSHPSDSMRRAMATISYEPGNVVVISSIENADFINYAGAKTLVDPRGSYLPGFEKRVDDINKLYHYTHVEDITSFMKRYNATYLWIDKNMLDQIWEGEDSGILYFFKYGDRMFFESFTSDDVRVLELINKDSFFNATLN